MTPEIAGPSKGMARTKWRWCLCGIMWLNCPSCHPLYTLIYTLAASFDKRLCLCKWWLLAGRRRASATLGPRQIAAGTLRSRDNLHRAKECRKQANNQLPFWSHNAIICCHNPCRRMIGAAITFSLESQVDGKVGKTPDVCEPHPSRPRANSETTTDHARPKSLMHIKRKMALPPILPLPKLSIFCICNWRGRCKQFGVKSELQPQRDHP